MARNGPIVQDSDATAYAAPNSAIDGSDRAAGPRVIARPKLYNLLFAYELQRRLATAGRRTISVAAHPRVCATEGTRKDASLQGKVLAGGRAQSPEIGVPPILDVATAPAVDGGACVGPDGFMQCNGHPTLVPSSRRSRDTALAARLWERSERLTGVHYAIEPLRATRG